MKIIAALTSHRAGVKGFSGIPLYVNSFPTVPGGGWTKRLTYRDFNQILERITEQPALEEMGPKAYRKGTAFSSYWELANCGKSV